MDTITQRHLTDQFPAFSLSGINTGYQSFSSLRFPGVSDGQLLIRLLWRSVNISYLSNTTGGPAEISLYFASVCIFKLYFNTDDWLDIFLKEDLVPVWCVNALFFSLFSGDTG